MVDRRDHIFDRREIPIVGRETPGQLPYSFNRIEIRTIGRKEFKPEPRLRSFSPLLMQRGVMVSSIIGDHDYSPAGPRADFRADLRTLTVSYPIICVFD